MEPLPRDNIYIISALPVTLEEAKRSTLCLSEFVGDNIALFSEEGYRTLLQIVDKIQTIIPEMLKICVLHTHACVQFSCNLINLLKSIFSFGQT